jgi:hypothetical protein
MCNGIKNRILDITKSSKRNKEITEYLDSHFKLFDRPIYNNVHTVIWNIQEKFSIKGDPVIPNNTFKCIEDFCVSHKKCGLFLRLELEEQ